MSEDKEVTKNGVKRGQKYRRDPTKVHIPKKFEKKGKHKNEAEKGYKGFQPGNPGGPGRPKMSDIEKKTAAINRQETRRLIHYYLALEMSEIQKLYNPKIPKDLPSIHYIIMGIIIHAGIEGDHTKAEWLWSQIWGKMSETIEIDLKASRGSAEAMFSQNIPIETLKKIIEMLKAAKENGDK